MGRNQFAEHWKQLRDKVQEKWPRLTGHLEGVTEPGQLIAKVQQRYWMSWEQAHHQVLELEQDFEFPKKSKKVA